MLKEAEDAKKIAEEERLKREAEHRQQEEVNRLQTLLPEEPDAKCGKPVSTYHSAIIVGLVFKILLFLQMFIS